MRRSLVLTAVLATSACADKEDAEAPPPPQESAAPRTAPDPTPPEPGGIGLGHAIAEAVGLAAAPSAGLDLLPGSATLVAGANLAAITKTTSWQTVEAMLSGGPGRTFRAATACNLGPETWTRATIAANPTTDDMALVLQATGVGTSKTLACLVEELNTAAGREIGALDDTGKRVEFEDGVGLVVSENVLLLTSKGWEQAVLRRREGKGPKAGDGDLKPLLKRTDRGKQLWLAAELPPEAQSASTMGLGMPAQDVTGWIDLAGGMELQVAIGVGDPEAARTKLTQMWAQTGSTAAALGVPQPVVDSVTFGKDDDAVTVSAKATDADLETIGSMISGSLSSL